MPERRDPALPAAGNGGASYALPTRLTSFVGREREIADVAALVSRRRLLTLAGAPGVGKTRLALEAATSSLGRLPDGVRLVELAPLGDPAYLPSAVAAVLEAYEQPGCVSEPRLPPAGRGATIRVARSPGAGAARSFGASRPPRATPRRDDGG